MKALSIVLLASAFLLSCGGDRLAGGSTSETSNGLMVRVVDASGAPAARVGVRLRPLGYLEGWSPATSDPASGVVDTSTDDSGRVLFSPGITGVRLEAFGKAGSVQAEIVSGKEGPVVHLAPTAKVFGKVSLHNGGGPARIQVRGMEHAVWTDSAGAFVLDSLPAGQIRLRAWIPGDLRSVESTFGLLAGGITDVGTLVPIRESGKWTDSTRIFLNTLDGGGAILTAVDSIPILVRLDGTAFPISARSGGTDLRVMDSVGNPLSFSVAQWSSVSRIAHVWVLVPTILAKDSSQWFRLRWGNASAEDASAPWTVFSAASGWSGAWDLNRTFVDRLGRRKVSDASSWADDGLLTGNLLPDAVDGLHFQGRAGEGFSMTGIGTDLTGSFTVLIRARPEAPCALFGRGDSVWNHHMKEFYLGAAGVTPAAKITHKLGWYPSFMASTPSVANVYSVAANPVDSGVWTLLVARRAKGVGDSGVVEWFLAGSKVSSSATAWTSYDADAPSDSLSVGARFGYAGRFRGAMAELWILRRAVSDDWIKLESECRKNTGTLVRLRP